MSLPRWFRHRGEQLLLLVFDCGLIGAIIASLCLYGLIYLTQVAAGWLV